ncbi:MAG: dihydroxyacetone kinase family protein [Fimbriimonadales bacterium]
MTDARTFAAEAIAGFVAANPRYVVGIDGGVIRATVIPAGRVGLVIGGGSGHYPAFAGLVGPGLAAGAACGNIFASPSSGQVYRVARSVERGAGLLLAFGNYAGDVLQFGLAAGRLREEGVDVRMLAVTDDIASAPAGQIHKRRGIAGDLAVFKIAGAAAEAGKSLGEVERLSRRANDRTRSLGVAFSGCTLPGAAAPLFNVTTGRMAVGLGVHGEPGLSEMPVTGARELADLLVGRLLAELPPTVDPRSSRAVAILNGLGSFKYEELFALYGFVHEVLRAAKIEIADTECGELVTSLDMAGVSLTLFWVDEELEALWKAPADSAAYRRGTVKTKLGRARLRASHITKPACEENVSEANSKAAAATLEHLRAVQATLLACEDELGRIDAVAGDGDHGIGMSRGVAGAVAAAERVVAERGSLTRLLIEAGQAWSDRGGGTSGALWGIALTSAGASLAGAETIDSSAVSRAVDAALLAAQELGKAKVGDKTLIDAFVPFADELRLSLGSGEDLPTAWKAAARCASKAAAETASLLPLIGRARPHAERSRGHPDAGAISFSRIVAAVGERLAARSSE